MVKAARLEADLVANTSQFEEGFKRAGKQLLSFGNIAKATLGSQIISGAAHKFAAALKAVTVEQFRAIEQQDNLAQSIGLSNRQFAALSRVAKEAGVDQDSLAKSITTTQKVIVGAIQGNDKYERSLGQINLRAEDLIKLSPDEQFEKIAVGLSKVQNATQRTVLAQELFGKAGRANINMLQDIGAKLDDARAFNDKFGLSLSAIDAEKVKEANTTFERVRDITKGLGNQLAIQLAPAITAVGQALIDSGFEAKDFGVIVSKALDFIAISIDNLRIAFLGIRAMLTEAAFEIDKFVVNSSKTLFEWSKASSDTLFPDAIFGKGLSNAEQMFLNINKNAGESLVKNKKALDELEGEAGKFVSVFSELEKARKDADTRAAKNVGNRPKNNGDPVGLTNTVDDKKIKSIMDGLREETEELKLQATLYGKKEGAVRRAQEALKVQNKLAEEGITLTQQQAAMIDGYLDSIEKQTDLNYELARAEEHRQEAFADLGQAVSSSFEDAIVNGEKLGDVLANLGKDIERIVTRLLITGPLEDSISDFFKGGGSSGGSSGGGFFDKILSFLPSFDVGTSRVPYDMVAQVHKDEMIVPAYDAKKMRNGGGSSQPVNVSLKIVDNAGVKISQSQRQGPGGPELTVQLDKAQAENMLRKGSASNQALQIFAAQSFTKRG